MELVELDTPDPVGVVCPGDEGLGRRPDVPEPEAAVVSGRGQVVLFVRVEVQGADRVVTCKKYIMLASAAREGRDSTPYVLFSPGLSKDQTCSMERVSQPRIV